MDNSFLHSKKLLLVDDEPELLKMVTAIQPYSYPASKLVRPLCSTGAEQHRPAAEIPVAEKALQYNHLLHWRLL
mgnify:CR=1 FL=1